MKLSIIRILQYMMYFLENKYITGHVCLQRNNSLMFVYVFLYLGCPYIFTVSLQDFSGTDE